MCRTAVRTLETGREVPAGLPNCRCPGRCRQRVDNAGRKIDSISRRGSLGWRYRSCTRSMTSGMCSSSLARRGSRRLGARPCMRSTSNRAMAHSISGPISGVARIAGWVVSSRWPRDVTRPRMVLAPNGERWLWSHVERGSDGRPLFELAPPLEGVVLPDGRLEGRPFPPSTVHAEQDVRGTH